MTRKTTTLITTYGDDDGHNDDDGYDDNVSRGDDDSGD